MGSILTVPTDTAEERGPKAITFWRIALAVFVGNLMTGILVAIILAFVKG